MGVPLYELNMQVINEQGEELCDFALQSVAVNCQSPPLSGNFPWGRCYMASHPQGSAIWVGNLKSHVLRNISAGLESGKLTGS